MGHRKYSLLALSALAMLLAGVTGCNHSDSLSFPVLPAPTPADAQTFAGSQVCRTCHQAIYETWEKTRHTKKVRAATMETIVNDVQNNGTNDFVEGGAGIAFDVGTSVPPEQTTFDDLALDPGIEYPKLGYDGTNLLLRIGPNTYKVTYVLGGTGKWKQRYMVTIGNQEYISPVQYNEITREYVPYHTTSWYTMSGSTLTGYVYGAGETPVSKGKTRDSWQRRCIACHVTGVRDLTKNADGEYGAKLADMVGATTGPRFSEMPIACEACHGPAKRHVELGGGRGTVLNPADMAADRGDEVCGRCHSRGSSVNAEGFGFPWKAGPLVDGAFRPGDVLADFYVQTPRDGSKYWDNGAQSANTHHQQWPEHATSEHGENGVTCWDCHEPHGSNIEGDLKAPVTELCLSCHDGDTEHNIDSADLSKHTRHTDESVQNCESCHFVKTAKSGIKYDINTHVYRVIFPVESETTPGLPNACAKCHKDKTNDELTEMVDARFGDVSPVAYARAEANPFGVGFDLHGNLSFDPRGGPITYQWSIKSGPPSFSQDELLAATSDDALFVPAAAGKYTFMLVVTNKEGRRSHPATVTVDVPAAIVQATPDLTQSFYVTSATCKACHPDTHADWQVTRHPLKIRRPNEGPGVVFADTDENGVSDWIQGGNPPSFDLASSPLPGNTTWDDIAFGPGISAPLIGYDAATDTYKVTIGAVTYDVTFLLGGTGKWKQRYVVTLGKGEYILPIQYNEKTQEWVPYHPTSWYSAAFDAFVYGPGDTPVTKGLTRDSWQRRCTYCHTTGARDMTRDPVTGEYADAIETMLTATTGPRLAELGVGCEACHGPGSQHVAAPSLRGAIVNPAKLSTQAANEACGVCHSRGTSVNAEGFGFPWGPTAVDGHFIPGMTISDFYTFKDATSSDFWQDSFGHSKSHHQQWLDYRWSDHFEAGMTCATCHNSHKDKFAGQLKQEVTTLCTSCHRDIVTGQGADNNHSLHDNAATTCTDCHLPLVAKSAIKYDIRAHDFDIIYPVNSKMMLPGTPIPNSCMNGACHTTPEGALGPWDPANVANLDEATSFINYFGDIAPKAVPRVDNGGLHRSATLTGPATVTLDGTRSYDPNDKGIIRYAWTILSAPAGNVATLSSRLVARPTIDLTVPGTYTFSLVVSDPSKSSKPKKVTVTIH